MVCIVGLLPHSVQAIDTTFPCSTAEIFEGSVWSTIHTLGHSLHVVSLTCRMNI